MSLDIEKIKEMFKKKVEFEDDYIEEFEETLEELKKKAEQDSEIFNEDFLCNHY